MRLVDLEPSFRRHEERREGSKLQRYDIRVPTIAEAQSVEFLCPACFTKNGGNVGTHLVIVTFRDRGVPDHLGSQSKNGGPSRWSVSGDSFENLTLQPSIDITPGCSWHGFITNGQVK